MRTLRVTKAAQLQTAFHHTRIMEITLKHLVHRGGLGPSHMSHKQRVGKCPRRATQKKSGTGTAWQLERFRVGPKGRRFTGIQKSFGLGLTPHVFFVEKVCSSSRAPDHTFGLELANSKKPPTENPSTKQENLRPLGSFSDYQTCVGRCSTGEVLESSTICRRQPASWRRVELLRARNHSSTL